MLKLILVTGLLVALSGLIRSVDAQTSSFVGYGSTNAGEIHLIDLDSSSLSYGISISSFNAGVTLPGLAIEPSGTTLYGSDQNGLLYSIDIATETTTLIGDMGLGAVVAMDFNGTELWVTDFENFPTLTIYSIDTSDASATLIQTFNPDIPGVVRAMTANTTKDVWIANDSVPVMDFQSVDTDPLKASPETNVTHIGSLSDPNIFFTEKIKGMDRAADGVLYGLAEGGGIYSIDQTSGLLKLIKDTGHAWLGLAADAPTTLTNTTPTIKIALDIKPKHCPNKLYVKKKWKKKRHYGDDDSSSDDGSSHKKKWRNKGILKAAILGTETFNVRDIEIYTIRLNGVEPKKYRYKDLTGPTVLNPCDCEALDADTFEDLVLYFKKKDIVDTLGDVYDGEEVPLTLIGTLNDGVTEIEGTDCVLIEDKGDDVSSDDISGRKKKWRKKGRHGDDDSSSR